MDALMAIGGWLGRTFDAKTIVALVLIGCSTWLAHDHIIDSATWAAMVTAFGGLWGAAAAVGTDAGREWISKRGEGKQ